MRKIIEVSHLSKDYGYKINRRKVLNNLSFSVEEGEFVGVMGASGAGKTTLMNILATILLPTMGSVRIDGQDITQMKEKELLEFRRKKMGFIFQEFNLISTLNAYDNIALPLAIEALDVSVMAEKVAAVAEVLGITPVLEQYPQELSMGQRQRVAAARALISHPEVLFADEPTGSLDSKSATNFLRYLDQVNQSSATTILMVTHDPYTASFCNRVLFIKDGALFSEVVRKSSRQEFFEKIIEMQATLGGGGKTRAQ